MKRVRNSGGHAPVLERKQFERLDSLRVAQNHGDLSALGAVGSLPLRAGLGCGHGSLLRRVPTLHVRDAALGDFKAGPAVLNHAVHVDVEQTVGVGFDLELGAGGEVLHFVLRVGPIPTVETSYPVTSDKSTPNATVRREAA